MPSAGLARERKEGHNGIMKIPSKMIRLFLEERGVRRNIAYFCKYVLALLVMVLFFSIIFHGIMNYEGRDYSWVTGVYWSLTVMSTLGFGDVTFNSDLGKLFSIVVLLAGMVSLIIVLPSAFIQFVYTPWVEAQKKKEARHDLPSSVRNHVIIVGVSPITRNLAQVLSRYGVYSVLLCSTTQQALDLMDQGLHAIVGDYDDAAVYRSLRADEARMVVAMDSDERNTNVAFTLREYSAKVPLVSRAEKDESIDILQLAGCTWVFQFRKALGQSLTRRVSTGRLSLSKLAAFGPLVVAEAMVKHTRLGGRTLRECNLRGAMGINVVGLWNHGSFEHAMPDVVLEEHMVLVMAGTREQMEEFSKTLSKEQSTDAAPGAVIIIGGGRVGRAAALAIMERGIDVVVIDKLSSIGSIKGIRPVVGDAADLAVLEKAGIRTAPSVIITTHDDDINIYLTIYCRRLRPDIQIISRTNLDRNVRVLHTAGANQVLSLASMVSNRIINLLEPGRVIMINEGLNIFKVKAGEALLGKTLITSGIRKNTRCNVVAVKDRKGEMMVNPDPSRKFCSGDELFIIGDSESETNFYEKYPPDSLLEEESECYEDMPLQVRESLVKRSGRCTEKIFGKRP